MKLKKIKQLKVTYLYIPFSLNTWHHFAFVRKSLTDITLYIDGIWYSETIPTNQFWSTTSFLMNPNGYMDEFRITKWIARYTTWFTVPIQAFPNQ